MKRLTLDEQEEYWKAARLADKAKKVKKSKRKKPDKDHIWRREARKE